MEERGDGVGGYSSWAEREEAPSGSGFAPLMEEDQELADVDILYPVPQKKFLTLFPKKWEDKWRSFDNKIIRKVQGRSPEFGSALYHLAFGTTVLTSIEIGIVVPAMAIAAGFDVAIPLAFLGLFTCLVSQIPKRFIWRRRPHMVGRAARLRADKTSSFPSRAVTCAVVYSFATAFYTLEARANPLTKYLVAPLAVLGSALLASWSRIYVGAHYPTDCLVGMVQGTLICFLSVAFEALSLSECGDCFEGGCYAGDATLAMDLHHLDRINWWWVCTLITISMALYAFTVMKPFLFWEKSHYSLALLLPVITLSLSVLCGKIPWVGGALAQPAEHHLVSGVIGAVVLLTGLGVGVAVKEKSREVRTLYFVSFYLINLVTLAVLRLP